MTRSRALKSKIEVILQKIATEIGDEFSSLQPFDATAADIYECIKRINEKIHGSARSDVLYIENSFITRCQNITVRAQQMGTYAVLVDRKSLGHDLTGQKISALESNYGIAKGATKTYKKGVLSFSLAVPPPPSKTVTLLDVDCLLALSRKSLAHKSIMKSLSSNDLGSSLSLSNSPFSPCSPQSESASPLFLASPSISRKDFIREGFTPDLTGLVVKPKQSSPSSLVNQVYVKDAGMPLSNLSAAAQIVPHRDFPEIVAAMRRAGDLNSGTFPVPFDVKPEHILCKTTGLVRSFTLIDSAYRSVTPCFLSDSVTRFTSVDKDSAHTVFGYSDYVLEKDTQFRATPYTQYECAFYVVADVIISTLAYISAAKHLQHCTLDALRDPNLVLTIAKQALAEIQFIPRLFVSWPKPFKAILTQALQDAQCLETREWKEIFTHNMPLHAAFGEGKTSVDSETSWPPTPRF